MSGIVKNEFQENKRFRNALTIILLLKQLKICQGGWSSSSSSNVDESLYSESGAVGWTNDYSYMKFTIHGCVYAQVNDLEDLACQEKDSEDGTYYWYQMVNCRRAQVAYSIYASSSSSVSCSNNDYMETLASMGGVYDFVTTLESYGANKYLSSDSFSNYPVCESDGNGYYEGLACSEDGDFIVAKFYDQYCLSYYSTSKTLSSISSSMQKYQCYDCSGGLCASLASSSDSCSPNDYSVCSDVTGNKYTKYKSVGSSSGGSSSSSSSGGGGGGSFMSGGGSSLSTKLKYTGGSILLISSFIMFLGILSTSRRKRKISMQRKYRTVGPDSFDDLEKRRSRRAKSRPRSSERNSRSDRDQRSRARRSRSRSRAAAKEKKKRSSSRRGSQRDRAEGTWA